MKLSITQLSDAAKMSTRTISRRLEALTPEIRGRAHLYEAAEALPLLFGAQGDGDLDLSQERAHLAHEQTRVTALKRRQLESRLIDMDVVTDRWSAILSNVKARLLSIPTSIAPAVATLQTPAEIEAAARDLVYQALEELAADVKYD